MEINIMIYLLRSSPHQIFADILIFLCVVAFSVIMLIPAKAQDLQNTSICPQNPGSIYLGTDEVRDNKLAKLETVLNIIAGVLEIAVLIGGAILIMRSIVLADSLFVIPIFKRKLGRRSQFISGCALIAMGLNIPATTNWLIVFLRDANITS